MLTLLRQNQVFCRCRENPAILTHDEIKYFVQKPAEKPEEVTEEKRIVSEVKNEGT